MFNGSLCKPHTETVMPNEETSMDEIVEATQHVPHFVGTNLTAVHEPGKGFLIHLPLDETQTEFFGVVDAEALGEWLLNAVSQLKAGKCSERDSGSVQGRRKLGEV